MGGESETALAVVAWCWLVAGVLIFLLNIPLYRERIGPHRWYGMRIPQAFTSDEEWYRINKYGAKLFMLWAVAILLLAVLALLVPAKPESFFFWMVVVGPSVLLLPIVVAIFRFANVERKGSH